MKWTKYNENIELEIDNKFISSTYEVCENFNNNFLKEPNDDLEVFNSRKKCNVNCIFFKALVLEINFVSSLWSKNVLVWWYIPKIPKACKNELPPVLVNLVNSSINNSKFP